MSDDQAFMETVDRYNADRNLGQRAFYSACYAPFLSLYFDQLGSVRVCCQNTKHTVGNIARQTLDEIWRGERIQELRAALRTNNLRKGCEFCEWQFLDGNSSGGFMRRFDNPPVDSPEPQFPQMMEFSISNTCNLECEMCNGEWSSLIRTRREKKPPLPKPYTDRFFDDLAQYLPHLKEAFFLGGEPFLQHEVARIWDMMIALSLQTSCHITTNGTQFNQKVERVLDSLPCHIAVSCDGATKDTLESVRRNTNFEQWRENFRRFHEYTHRRNTHLGINFCLMTVNWREFMDLLLFAEDWNTPVCVNLVTSPQRFSLYRLDASQLTEILNKLQEQQAQYGDRLRLNRKVWDDEVTRLRLRLANAQQTRSFQQWGYLFPAVNSGRDSAREADQIMKQLTEWAGAPPVASFDAGENEWVDTVEVLDQANAAVDWREGLGRHISIFNEMFCRRFGWQSELLQYQQDEHRLDIIQSFSSLERPAVFVRAITIPRFAEDGHRVGTRTYVAIKQCIPTEWVAIQPLASRDG